MPRRAATPSTDQLAILTRVVRQTARARRLSVEDAQDFEQSVHLKLLERHYDIFERFEGRSSLTAYLGVVVNRLLLDWRNATYGRWRPSSAAVRMGVHAVELERFLYRDGYSLEEALARSLSAAPGTPARSELIRIAARLPVRPPRQRISEDVLQDAGGPGFEDPIEMEEQRRSATRTRRALRQALQRLSSEDRWLIDARFAQGRPVQAVARALAIAPRPLYRRFDRVLGSLRQTLTRAGVTGTTMGA